MHNTDAPFVLVLALMVVGVLIAIVVGITQQQQTQQLLERIASRFRGRVVPGDLWNSPQVRLKFEGHSALLQFKRVGKNAHQTIFTIAWPDRGLRCEIYPQDIFSGFRKLWGMEDIEIGSPQ